MSDTHDEPTGQPDPEPAEGAEVEVVTTTTVNPEPAEGAEATPGEVEPASDD